MLKRPKHQDLSFVFFFPQHERLNLIYKIASNQLLLHNRNIYCYLFPFLTFLCHRACALEKVTARIIEGDVNREFQALRTDK